METVRVVARIAGGSLGSVAEAEAAVAPLAALFLAPAVPFAARHIARRARRNPPPAYRVFPRLGLVLGTVPGDNLAVLHQSPLVAAVESIADGGPSLIQPVETHRTHYPVASGWGAEALNVPPLWRKGLSGKGVVVGHLDTGIDATHQALRRRLAGFARYDLDGRHDRRAEPRDSDGDGHGTHTAGIIVGEVTSKGIIGIAPGALLASAEVIEGGDVVTRVLQGLEWMLGQRVSIINMSLGLAGFRGAFLAAIQALDDAGILTVAAIGNEGPGKSRSPGNYRGVISVGAIDQARQVADFSGHASIAHDPPAWDVPTLVAPGVDIVSAVQNGGYASMNGTSMAAPHIAGLAALLKEAVPTATAAQLRDAIIASCRPVAAAPPARYGAGLPDADNALAHLQATGLAPKP
jgi:subtilisin family serine protease